MAIFLKSLRYSQRGFTLIEILVIIAALGIIAATIIVSAAGFRTTGIINAANSEAVNVRTAAIGYRVSQESWPETSEVLDSYLSGEVKATYTFDTTTGRVSSATTDADGWGTNIWFNSETQMWEKGAPP